ncbi:hypothetical protein HanRHA438_Chr12g0563501 [Helianthus annuus]|uniref:Uncharacterized protein n=1 Tax=Helianthus annuus TaxID=4232 RepID=A0A9K3HIB9_HELAN|nr:hypothetical protein HanXRQr2_Chr12g0552141 [Helianthus annuus]KAJ0506095.1 hypothetical protein HanHA89_Chr12g0478051 [Helianthus annuus]KAJ0675766.1 hypothetical protein HanLR1_Chr12g0454951 [Helianthus annuus]KAJ0867465.1 hypothetical protein HanRHA438_Chr12g0563501 [Helianthus annuus]
MVLWPLSIITPIDATFIPSSHFENRETCVSTVPPPYRRHRQPPLQLLQVQSVPHV